MDLFSSGVSASLWLREPSPDLPYLLATPLTRSASGERYMLMVKTLQKRPSCWSRASRSGTRSQK